MHKIFSSVHNIESNERRIQTNNHIVDNPNVMIYTIKIFVKIVLLMEK